MPVTYWHQILKNFFCSKLTFAPYHYRTRVALYSEQFACVSVTLVDNANSNRQVHYFIKDDYFQAFAKMLHKNDPYIYIAFHWTVSLEWPAPLHLWVTWNILQTESETGRVICCITNYWQIDTSKLLQCHLLLSILRVSLSYSFPNYEHLTVFNWS